MVVGREADVGSLGVLEWAERAGLDAGSGLFEQLVDVPSVDAAPSTSDDHGGGGGGAAARDGAATFVVNLGDMLQHWTRGVLRATPHRVRLPRAERYSVAFFYDPHWSTVVAPLDASALSDAARAALDDADGSWRLADEPIQYGQYYLQKYDNAYKNIPKDNSKLRNYRV